MRQWCKTVQTGANPTLAPGFATLNDLFVEWDISGHFGTLQMTPFSWHDKS